MSTNLNVLVEMSKEDNNALLEVILLFEPKLKASLYQTQPLHRDDLHQELMYKLIKCVRKYDVQSVPGFWDLKDHINSQT